MLFTKITLVLKDQGFEVLDFYTSGYLLSKKTPGGSSLGAASFSFWRQSIKIVEFYSNCAMLKKAHVLFQRDQSCDCLHLEAYSSSGLKP
jgi:hypothetical protein